MKQWHELTREQQIKAWHKAINDEITFIIEMGEQSFVFFPHLAGKIKEAVDEADRMQTPWFFGEILLEKLPYSIPKEALIRAKEYLYSEFSDKQVITGITY